MKTLHTPEELVTYKDGKGYELVQGVFVEKQGDILSSLINSSLTCSLVVYCQETRAALCFSSSMGYLLPGQKDTVRKPSVSVVRADHIGRPLVDVDYFTIAPDLAVEVVSQFDKAEAIESKTCEYLQAGVPLVWVVFPKSRTIAVRRVDGTATILGINDELTGEDVLPGFHVKVSDIFPDEAP